MALPTYNVEYVEIDKNGIKTVELWEDGGFKYSKNRQRDGKIYFRCNKVRKVCTALYNTCICNTYNIKFSLLYIHVGSWVISVSVSVHICIYIRQQRVVRQRELPVFLNVITNM